VVIPARRSCARASRGFSLIELMVSLAIGLVLTLAITTLLTRNEANRRGLNSSNDMEANGAYLAMQLDRSLRSAGSGLVHKWDTSFGCALIAARSGNTILPVPAAQATALGEPFSSLPSSALAVRLAPLVIHSNVAGDTDAGGNGDVLAIMSGAGGVAEVARDVLPGSVSQTELRLANTLGMRGGDLVTVMQQSVGCTVQQVTAGFTGSTDQALPLTGGVYASGNLLDYKYADGTQLMELGNPTNRPAQFAWIGVGPNDSLLSYDLLQVNGRGFVPLPLAEGVSVMRAVYGVDTTGDGRLDSWHSASEVGYRAADLLTDDAAKRAAANKVLHSIVAVRVALILSSTLVERETAPMATKFTLFGDLPDVSVDVDLSDRADFSTQEKRRHRVFEFTVPLRNAMTADPL
jgi:type IV pilus assembly protein PilW